MTGERGRVGRPPKVNREQVVFAAAEILNSDGATKFSMRALAARLEISPMGVYHYFDSKSDLLCAVLEYHNSKHDFPELSEDPRERLVEVTMAAIDNISKHPWVIDVLAGDQAFDSYSVWALDEFLKSTEELHMPPDKGIAMVFGLWRIIVGEVMVQSRRALDAPTALPWYLRPLSAEVRGRPRVASLVERMKTYMHEYDVEESVRSYLAGELDLPPRSVRPPDSP